jgi:hypothetical protein
MPVDKINALSGPCRGRKGHAMKDTAIDKGGG